MHELLRILIRAGAHVLKRFTMVSSLSSDLPLDSPLFSNRFFISSCMHSFNLPINSIKGCPPLSPQIVDCLVKIWYMFVGGHSSPMREAR